MISHYLMLINYMLYISWHDMIEHGLIYLDQRALIVNILIILWKYVHYHHLIVISVLLLLSIIVLLLIFFVQNLSLVMLISILMSLEKEFFSFRLRKKTMSTGTANRKTVKTQSTCRVRRIILRK